MLSKPLTNCLKGIAVVLVIISHFLGGGFVIRYFTPLGGIGVSIFLFLSGYGINESFLGKGLKGYWAKRINRILIPYLVWCGIWAILIRLFSFNSPFFLRYWYLEYLFLWYALFYFTKRLIPRCANWVMLVITVCLFPFLDNLESEQSFSFILGVLVSDYKGKIVSMNKRSFFLLALLLFIFGSCCLFVKQIPMIRHLGDHSFIMKLIQLGLKLPLGLSLIIFSYLFIQKTTAELLLGFVGIISLELYLVQMPFPPYIQASAINLASISLLVIITSIALHYISNGVNCLIKKEMKF